MSGAHLLDHLAANPLLTLMLVLSTGALLGQIKFGPLRFGAAGALFMGLVIGAYSATPSVWPRAPPSSPPSSASGH